MATFVPIVALIEEENRVTPAGIWTCGFRPGLVWNWIPIGASNAHERQQQAEQRARKRGGPDKPA
jgi:hypothetical protein